MKYIATVTRMTTATARIEVTAKNEDEATEKVLAECERMDRQYEWEPEDETFDVEEIEESSE